MLWTMFSIIYALIATISIYMTWREHIMKKRPSIVWTLVGMLTCLVWPVAVAVLSMARGRRAA
jgi:hypothetical protein